MFYMHIRLNGSHTFLQATTRIENLYQASKYAIETALPEEFWVSIIEFNTDANNLSQFVEIDNASRSALVRLLPTNTSGMTCIPCGLDKAISVRHYHLSRYVKKKNLLICPPNKTQIYLRDFDQSIRCLHEVICILSCSKFAQWRFWAACVKVKVDLNLSRMYISENRFTDSDRNDKHSSRLQNQFLIWY